MDPDEAQPRGKDSGLPPSKAVTPLRQPRETTINELASSIEKTSLHSNSMSENSKQSPCNSTLSPHAPAFYPRNFQPYEEPQSPSLPEAELQTFITDVTLNPASFESKLGYLRSTLENYVRDARSLHSIVSTIFEQGIYQSNFRYSAARLCNHLASKANFNVKNCDKNEFLNILLQRCHEEYLKRNNLASGDDGEAYLRGFVLFVGELFSQMQLTPSERTEQATVLAQCIPNMLDTLLQSPIKENIKCVVQVLKLTGAKLEDLEKVSGDGRPVVMEKLIYKLKEMVQRRDLDETSKLMLKNVVGLRESDWGRGVPCAVVYPPVADTNTFHSTQPQDLPVMYGPDGEPLSSEEANFLETECQNSFDDPNEGSPDEYEGGMDAEAEAAYEEFLRESGL
ncbi:polyadenylate-binding protein-interacting protein 1-like isoform X2 [Ornithodoros turicata]|uniref:polyadenylate-binding protein-interacting protein 1-like isoform X2 n=2 Tax=Ornithodoros turicata TaxID=34597 RepID=UPI00313978E7